MDNITNYATPVLSRSSTNHSPVTAEDEFQSQISPCENYEGRIGAGTGFLPTNPVFTCQYNSTNDPYSFTNPHQRYVVPAIEGVTK